MTKEEYIKNLIISSGYNLTDFANKIQMPYSTLIGILKRGLSGASVYNVLKICNGLSISVEQLDFFERGEKYSPLDLTEMEKLIIRKYRENTQVKHIISYLMDILNNKY